MDEEESSSTSSSSSSSSSEENRTPKGKEKRHESRPSSVGFEDSGAWKRASQQRRAARINSEKRDAEDGAVSDGGGGGKQPLGRRTTNNELKGVMAERRRCKRKKEKVRERVEYYALLASLDLDEELRAFDEGRIARDNLEEQDKVFDKMRGGNIMFDNVLYKVRERSKGKYTKYIPCWKHKRTLLQRVSGHFKPGTMTAIMGPSGAGKTSLLQALSGRLPSSKWSGLVTVDDQYISPKRLQQWARIHCAFCPQEEYLWPLLTVKETLEFAARLYLPTASKKRRSERVHNVLQLTELTDVAKVRVGSDQTKTLSGGQRRRLSIGMELIKAPEVLYLDEPTTGLDATGAWTVVDLLRRLADSGRTVVCVIHQPRPEVFNTFDHLLILHQGRAMYNGLISDVKYYFKSLGFPVPADCLNPADFYIDTVSQEELPDWTPKPSIHKKVAETTIEYTTKKRTRTKIILGWFYSFFYLIHREGLLMRRDILGLVLPLILHIFMATVLGSVYSDLSHDAVFNASYSLNVVIYWVWGMGHSACFRTLDTHSLVQYEVRQGMYSELPYYIANFIVDTSQYLLGAFIYAILWYWVVDYAHTGQNFIYFVVITNLLMLTATTANRTLVFLFPQIILVNAVFDVFSISCNAINGWTVTYPEMPDFWTWLFYINPFAYFLGGTIQRELDERGAAGAAYKDFLDYPYDNPYVPIFCLVGLFLGNLTLGYLAFKFLHKNKVT